ncbi:acyl-CoA thioesterase [Subsaximicrobium wynnwilliamsii]|jgi:acyl-CoA thioester hydrolase|uniref:Acyl-CoA thioesterase n=1 Tax=Subsaximicrobium wynnwilliamsii TaxID=291179 RepID=A0A5C6ZKH4_9FLAO|nr:thioesterase family protein [Subsaximicrobium wynnwilliamsii]TXD84223.1 acyl-CoA thioesterase [Subsaximicrobium wynnwilliamsii]TXD89844.1 acyl-CoA thioesterase [Subsaximicrobium wynnwilliamsii]TXE03935.1 acyl-CoA thioesterase [Subsaximicrobium wynnwilliamsii]
MQTYEKHIVVAQEDIDIRSHVNNVRYVEWVQDIAQEHWDSKITEKLKKTYYWIMLSHFIEYKAEAILGDVLRLETFVTKADGVRSTRQVRIYDKNTNKLLTSSETMWCFMSHKTNRPTRITEEIQSLFS